VSPRLGLRHITIKIQAFDLEPTFESIDLAIINIIDLGVSHGNIMVIFSLKPF
jgi:hypothetical protein